MNTQSSFTLLAYVFWLTFEVVNLETPPNYTHTDKAYASTDFKHKGLVTRRRPRGVCVTSTDYSPPKFRVNSRMMSFVHSGNISINVSIYYDEALYTRLGKSEDETKKFCKVIVKTAELYFRQRNMEKTVARLTFNIVSIEQKLPDSSEDKDIDFRRDRFCTEPAKPPVGLRILLTGKNQWFTSRYSSEVVGVATQHGLCGDTKNCIVVQATSFMAGLILAHEIAHTFGAVHDGQPGAICSYGHMMSASTTQGGAKWSTCTLKRMRQHLKTSANLGCLYESKDVDLDEQFSPGKEYDASDQCKYYLGSNFHTSKAEKYKPNMCKVLHCTNGLVTIQTSAALPGTACGILDSEEYACSIEGHCTKIAGTVD